MNSRQYNIGELRKVLLEASKEFKPVLGDNVEKDNKKINQDAYSEMEKATKKYDGGEKNESKKKVNYPQDDNKGMQDLQYDNINDSFKQRVKSQMKGYVSSEAEKQHKNDPFGNAEFNDIKGMEDKANAMKDGDVKAKSIGLTSKEIDKKEFDKQSSTVFENKHMSRLKFKNTVFMTEEHVLSRVPDDFKIEGKTFVMKDKNDNEFLVEWAETPRVINKTKIVEQKNRIHELFNYKSANSKTTNSVRLNEDSKVNDMVNKARQLMK